MADPVVVDLRKYESEQAQLRLRHDRATAFAVAEVGRLYRENDNDKLRDVFVESFGEVEEPALIKLVFALANHDQQTVFNQVRDILIAHFYRQHLEEDL
jgi:hypothetical protein